MEFCQSKEVGTLDQSSGLIRMGLLEYDGNSPVFLQGQKFTGPSRSEGLG